MPRPASYNDAMIELIRSNLDAIRGLCRLHGVARLFLVGSAATGEFDPSRSDVDFVVVFEPHERRGLSGPYFSLLADLRRLLARDVDLIEAHCIENPYVRASLEHSRVSLYDAA